MALFRDAIFDRLLAALNAGTKPAGVPACVDSLTYSLDPDQLPKVTLSYKQDEPERVGGRRGPIIKRRLILTIEVWTTSTAAVASPPAAALTARDNAEPILAWVSKAIGAVDVALPTRVAHDPLDEGMTTWLQGNDGEVPVCLATVEVLASYQTRSDNAEAWA